IRDRLRVLLPNDPGNYYRQRDIIPAQSLEQLGQTKILITNFHGFGLREKVAAGKRSEEHTSELQSHLNLVCRLLLEKKKITPKRSQTPPSDTADRMTRQAVVLFAGQTHHTPLDRRGAAKATCP